MSDAQRIDVGQIDTESHKLRLMTKLGLSESEAAYMINMIASAGAKEMLDYCTGQVVPTSIVEFRSNRINYLIASGIGLQEAVTSAQDTPGQEVDLARIDLENLIAALFQVPLSTAKRLLQVAASRFAYEWDNDLRNAVKSALENRTTWNKRAACFETVAPSALLRGWMENQVRMTAYSPLVAGSSGSVIRIPSESYEYLCRRVDAKAVAPE